MAKYGGYSGPPMTNIALGYGVWPHAWREPANKFDESHNEGRKQAGEFGIVAPCRIEAEGLSSIYRSLDGRASPRERARSEIVSAANLLHEGKPAGQDGHFTRF